jgi:hypothetical protein
VHDDFTQRLQRGQVWVFHKPLRLPLQRDAVIAHLAANQCVAVFAQVWFDANTLKSVFEARIAWTMAHTAAITPEPLDIDALRRSG